ncbi:MAG: leucine-rich repeat domain-containing protein, partial [Alphaproteobacteria bacterium]
VKILVNIISQFPTLQTLDLSENQIGDEGFKEIKDAVSKKVGLKINIDGQKPGQNPTNPSGQKYPKSHER